MRERYKNFNLAMNIDEFDYIRKKNTKKVLKILKQYSASTV
jgi:hypothetical protein